MSTQTPLHKMKTKQTIQNSRIGKAIALAAGVTLAVCLLTGCHKSTEPEHGQSSLTPVKVSVQAAVSRTRVATEEVMGTVQPKTRATVEAKVAGRILQMPVTIGQRVNAGDPLALIDVREIEARLDQARAMLAQAKKDYDRFTTLLRQGAVTQAEFDGIEARYKAAEAAVREAESMLDYARVSAPFNGVITRKYADVGDFAAPGRPLLELEDPTTLRFEADVPEAICQSIHPGMTMTVSFPTLKITLEGVVAEVAPAADPISRTMLVKLDLPQTQGLKSGMFGRLAVPVGQITSVWVPASAVVKRGQMEIVFVATQGHAQMRLVKVGKRTNAEVELLSGVDNGELIVVDGAPMIRDGQPLVVEN